MSSMKILVVDDDRANCDLVSRMLSARGYVCDVAGNGEAALELAARTPYALAVLDYQMPGMDGVELFRKVRELQPEMVGVFLTAYTSINTVFPAIDAGIERVLAKPADARELASVVEGMIGPAMATK